ncbi:MAG: hypothetical protein ACI3ZX_01430 [Candidatus Aphodosoma sp.]
MKKVLIFTLVLILFSCNEEQNLNESMISDNLQKSQSSIDYGNIHNQKLEQYSKRLLLILQRDAENSSLQSFQHYKTILLQKFYNEYESSIVSNSDFLNYYNNLLNATSLPEVRGIIDNNFTNYMNNKSYSSLHSFELELMRLLDKYENYTSVNIDEVLYIANKLNSIHQSRVDEYTKSIMNVKYQIFRSSLTYWSNKENLVIWNNICYYSQDENKDNGKPKDNKEEGKDPSENDPKEDKENFEKLKKFVEADLYGCAGGAVFGPFAAGAAGLLCSAMEAYSWPENECYRYTMASNN